MLSSFLWILSRNKSIWLSKAREKAWNTQFLDAPTVIIIDLHSVLVIGTRWKFIIIICLPVFESISASQSFFNVPFYSFSSPANGHQINSQWTNDFRLALGISFFKSCKLDNKVSIYHVPLQEITKEFKLITKQLIPFSISFNR